MTAILADTCVNMRKILKALKKYGIINKLEINVKKTQIVIFRKGGHSHNYKYGSFMYDKTQKIDIVPNFEYLGVFFSNSETFFNEINQAISKANVALGTTVSLLNRLKLKSWSPVIRLFKCLTVSNLFYAIQVWDLRYLDDIEIIQNTFLKKMLFLPKNTLNYAL